MNELWNKNIRVIKLKNYRDKCPYCGSRKVVSNSKFYFLLGLVFLFAGLIAMFTVNNTMLFFVFWISILLGVVLLIAAFVTRHDRKCKECGKVWKEKY